MSTHAFSAPISSLLLLLVQTWAARWKATTPEQLTGARLYPDIAKSCYLFHAFENVMEIFENCAWLVICIGGLCEVLGFMSTILCAAFILERGETLSMENASTKYSKTWVSDHLAWATTLPWATVFSCTDAILVHFTLSPATTWQTQPVTYIELVIYLINATIILLQNTKLTVKFTGDGRPYRHLTPHCRWPGRLLFMVGPWLTGTMGSQTPYGLLTIAHPIALASINVFLHVSMRKICPF